MTDEKRPSSGGITKLLATFGTALIMFFASIVWRSYENTTEALEKIFGRVKTLEDDKSKWGTLTELTNKTISMEIEMGRLEGMMQGFSLAVQGGMVKRPEVGLMPTPLPFPIPIPFTIPGPKVIPSKPDLKEPRELFKNSEEYRKLQQHKYPSPDQSQK